VGECYPIDEGTHKGPNAPRGEQLPSNLADLPLRVACWIVILSPTLAPLTGDSPRAAEAGREASTG